MDEAVRPADRSDAADRSLRGQLSTPTRRDFIRGIAAAGASTAGAVAMQRTGVDLFAETAVAGGRSNSFSNFTAIAPSSNDSFDVPPGFRADVLISWGSQAAPLRGQQRLPGLLPAQGQPRGAALREPRVSRPLLPARLQADGSAEDAGAGPGGAGQRRQLDPSRPATPQGALEGRLPLAVQPARPRRSPGPRVHRTALRGAGNRDERPRVAGQLLGRHNAVRHRALMRGELRRLRDARDAERGVRIRLAPVWRPARGRRIRVPGLQEVRLGLRARFIRPGPRRPQAHGARPLPAREHRLPARARQALRALHGRRQGTTRASTSSYPTADSGAATIRATAAFSRPASSPSRAGSPRAAAASPPRATPSLSARPRRPGAGFRWQRTSSTTRHQAACAVRCRVRHPLRHQPPGDLEVAEDGSVFIALTNNSTVLDSHGSVRRLREEGNDPEALEFRWRDYAAGGPTGSTEPGEEGFSSPTTSCSTRPATSGSSPTSRPPA